MHFVDENKTISQKAHFVRFVSILGIHESLWLEKCENETIRQGNDDSHRGSRWNSV
jgi:hypothetical protein